MTAATAKAISQEFLRYHRVEFSENLPQIEALEELTPQSAPAVATRIVVLSYVLGIGFGADARHLKAALERFGLFARASGEENALLSRTDHTPQEKVAATWLIECVQSLLWCLGLVELAPFQTCGDDQARHVPQPFTDPLSFIASASLRPMDEIYQQADLHYRLHWAARNARFVGRPSRLKEGLISERRKALDWVIGVEENWDEIPMDT